jgi:hypothetical protein
MKHSRLASIRGQTAPLLQNRKLFETLRNDRKRELFYKDLKAERFPALVFKSVLRKGGDTGNWPSEDVYLLTAREHIEAALRTGSVAPYAALDSGGRFMLGQDEFGQQPECPHAKQRKIAVEALHLDEKTGCRSQAQSESGAGELPSSHCASTIEKCVKAAVERAMVLPQKRHQFDLVTDVAEQAALRLMALVFGMPAKSDTQVGRGKRRFFGVEVAFVERDGHDRQKNYR